MIFNLTNFIKLILNIILKKRNRVVLKRFIYLNGNGFNNHTSKNLNNLIEILHQSEFYKKIITSKNIKNLDKNTLNFLPLLNKKLIRKYIDQIICKNFNKKKLIKNSSGGSTGEKAIFYQTDDHKIWHTATCMALYNKYGIKPWQNYGLLLWGNPNDLKSNSLPKIPFLKFLIGKNVQLNSSYLNDDNFSRLVSIMKTYKINVIRGYSESLYQLSKYINRIGLKIHKPRLVICTASDLTPKMENEIKLAFSDTNIIDFYGSREVGAIGYRDLNSNDGLKFFENMNYVEVIKNGQLLITNFTNKAMPLVRYEIGDIADICEKGYIRKIKGRKSYLLFNEDGTKVDGTFLTTFLNEFDNIEKFQIIQISFSQIDIKLVMNYPLSSEDEKKIKTKFIDTFGKNTKIDLFVVDEIKRSPSGKYLYVESKING